MAYDIFDFALPNASALTGGVTGGGGNDLKQQVDAWIATPPAAWLTIVYIGHDDIRTQSAQTASLSDYGAQLDRLIAAGATAGGRAIIVAILPDFNKAPGSGNAWATRVSDFNTGVAALTSGRSGVYVVDLYAPFEDVYANPGLYGLTNVTDNAEGDLAGWLWGSDTTFTGEGQRLLALIFDYCLRYRWDLTEAGNEQSTLNAEVITFLRANSTPVAAVAPVVFTRVQYGDSGHWGGANYVTVNWPATPAVGNLLVACAFHRSQIAAAPSISGSGWVLREWLFTGDGLANDRRGLAVFTKVAGASEPGSVTATWSGAASSRMTVHEFNADDVDYAWQFLQSAAADSGTGATGSGSNQMAGTTDSPVGPFAVGDAAPGGQSLCRIGYLAGRTYDTALPGASFAVASGGLVEAAGAAFQTSWACGFVADGDGGTGLTETTSWTNAQLQVSTAALIFGGANATA